VIPGRDYIGIGVGAMVFDNDRRVFLSRRGPVARNERGTWEFPGGMVEFGERLEEALLRELYEEYGIRIRLNRLLGVFDHLVPAERQHWVSVTFIARHVSGTAKIREPDRCSEIGWFAIESLPAPLSLITQQNFRAYVAPQ
jgi:8-oxo-dGTP diphosphatase